jgi:large subunit ribosomal protein L10
MTLLPSQMVLEEKSGEVEEIKQLLQQYKSIGVANLQKVRASQLQELKKTLGEKVYMRVLKNTLMKIAIESINKEELKKLEDCLEGSNIYLFSNLNPFKLALFLEKGKVRTTAKSGDIAYMDVVVPAGNTGQPPGPVISQFNSAGLPTRIESGSVWISKDTLVVRKGEAINERLAGVLSKLGIKAVELGISMRAILDDGLMIGADQLKLDIDGTKNSVGQSFSEAFGLSLSVAFPTPETMVALLQTAHQKAFALSLNAAVPTKETIGDLIRKANAEMTSLKTATERVQPKA